MQMIDAIVAWDMEDDPDGNVQHIAEHGINDKIWQAYSYSKDVYAQFVQSISHKFQRASTHGQINVWPPMLANLVNLVGRKGETVVKSKGIP